MCVSIAARERRADGPLIAVVVENIVVGVWLKILIFDEWFSGQGGWVILQ